MNLTAVLDHTALAALYRADSFFTGLYIEASRGTGRVLIPSLSVLAAERQVAGAGKHAASLRSRRAFRSPRRTRWMRWTGLTWTGPRCCDRLACGEGGRAADGPVAGP